MSNHITTLSDEQAGTAARQISEAISNVRRIGRAGSITPETRDQLVSIARDAIHTFDSIDRAQLPGDITDQVFILTTLQQFAYHEVDADGITDIADWCMDRWLAILQNNASCIAVFRGM